jgi:hypothetical protein
MNDDDVREYAQAMCDALVAAMANEWSADFSEQASANWAKPVEGE